ncbi:hypothetical protein [Pseudonocardia sp. GCM10023141]|uniref:hypothetical protein n=1 Tax=Pseudonocardia sp. GCM10023141 TaxID=3252653 RepID=UPI0036160CF7
MIGDARADGLRAVLHAAVDDVSVVAPVERIVAAGRRRARRRRVAQVLVTVAVVVAVAVLVPVGLGIRRAELATPPGCAAVIAPAVLPAWARAGFTDPEPVMPYVLSDHGRIAAILFANPPTAPPAPDRQNKILWVVPEFGGTGPLTITATLGSTTATRTVADGPGPSIVDLPEPGCWELRLEWAGGSDTMGLRYGP